MTQYGPLHLVFLSHLGRELERISLKRIRKFFVLNDDAHVYDMVKSLCACLALLAFVYSQRCSSLYEGHFFCCFIDILSHVMCILAFSWHNHATSM